LSFLQSAFAQRTSGGEERIPGASLGLLSIHLCPRPATTVLVKARIPRRFKQTKSLLDASQNREDRTEAIPFPVAETVAEKEAEAAETGPFSLRHGPLGVGDFTVP
jgi:hypothetical protein